MKPLKRLRLKILNLKIKTFKCVRLKVLNLKIKTLNFKVDTLNLKKNFENWNFKIFQAQNFELKREKFKVFQG